MNLLYRLVLITSLISLITPTSTVFGETDVRIEGVVVYKDQKNASGIKVEVLENEVVIKSDKTDRAGKYRLDFELEDETQVFTIRLQQDKIQTHHIEFDVSETNIKADFIVNKLPIADANGEYHGFINEPIIFNSQGSTDPDQDPLSYDWNFDDEKHSDEPNPTHTYNIPGEYSVLLTIIDIDGATNSDTTKCIIENKAPIIMLNGPYQTKEGTPLTFESTGTTDPDGTVESYFWEFDDGSTSNAPNPTHTYQTKGDYTVKLTITDNFGSQTTGSTKCNVIQNEKPIANANGPYTCNLNDEILFTSQGSEDPDDTEISIIWDFGDETSSNEPNPTHTYLTEGQYTVTLTVTDPSGETTSDTSTATVLPPLPRPPYVKVNGPYQGYTHNAIYFSSIGSYDPDSEILDYLWDFGDGQYSYEPSPVHIYIIDETYTVSLTITDSTGLSNIESTTCKISKAPPVTTYIPPPNLKPTAEGNGPYTGVVQEQIQFTSTNSYDPEGKPITYHWNFGDGNNSTEPNPTHTYDSPGNFNVTLKITDNNAKTDTYKTITTITPRNIPPAASIDVQRNGKIGEEIFFNSINSTDPDGNITEYYWEFGDGTFSIEPTPVHTYLTPNNYTVTLTVTDEKGSRDTVNTFLKIVDNIQPSPVIKGPSTVEAGTSINLTAEDSYDADGNIIEYLFDFGDKTFTYGPNVSHTYILPGTYLVTLTVKDDNLCENMSNMTCTVYKNEPPEVISKGPYIGISGEAVTFDPIFSDVDGWVSKVHWDFGDGTTSNKKKPVHVFEDPGEYFVRITLIDNQGKTSEATTMTVISPKQELNFPVITSISIFSILSVILLNHKFGFIDF